MPTSEPGTGPEPISPRQLSLLWILPVVALAVLLGLLFWNRPRGASRIETLNVSFTVVGEIQPRSLADFRGRVVLFHLWSSADPDNRHDMVTLNALAARYGAQGLLVITASDEDMNRISAYPMVRGARFLVAGIDARTAQTLPATRPHSFLIDRLGNVAGEFPKTLDYNEVERSLKPLLGL